MVSSKTHVLFIEEDLGRVRLWRIEPREGEGALYYITGYSESNHQVTSYLREDLPAHGGLWVSGISPGGVDYVSHGMTRAVAMRKWRAIKRELAK